MKRNSLVRPVMRRADAGVDTISVNGGTPISGPVALFSPMATQSGQNIFVDNANRKVLGAAPVQADINTDVNNAFFIPKLTGALVMPIPAVPLVGQIEFRKVTFSIISRGNAADTVTFTGGAGGYNFANNARAGALGPFLADFNSLLAGMANGDMILIGFEYHTALAAPWLCVALSGPYS